VIARNFLQALSRSLARAFLLPIFDTMKLQFLVCAGVARLAEAREIQMRRVAQDPILGPVYRRLASEKQSARKA